MNPLTPFLIGLFSSVHCLAMCGGMCGLFCRNSPSNKSILVINLGRITTYLLLGMVFAGIVQGLALRVPIAQIGFWMRSFLGVVLIFLGMRIILNKNSLHTFFENNFLWKKAKRKLVILNANYSLFSDYIKGLLWGLIPCGLLYSILIAAAATQNVLHSGLFMFAFGLGTLPSMFVAAGLLKTWQQHLQSKTLRFSAGMFIMTIGLWSFVSPWFSHELIPNSTVFTSIVAFLDSCVP